MVLADRLCIGEATSRSAAPVKCSVAVQLDRSFGADNANLRQRFNVYILPVAVYTEVYTRIDFTRSAGFSIAIRVLP